MDQTLCWDCRNATEKDCEWSRYFKPVPGWEATRHTTKTGDTTYVVHRCPRFCRDSWHYGTYRTKKEYTDYLDGVNKRKKQKEERERRKNEQADNHREPD